MNYKKLTEDLTDWVRRWFLLNGTSNNIPSNAIIGVSGGVKSAVAAALMKEAIGKQRVIAIIMRDKREPDEDNDAIYVCNHMDIQYHVLPIYPSVNAMKNVINLDCKVGLTEQAVKNLPARIRMSALYTMSQSLNGRVINTSCLSDNYIGNVTLWGDQCGDLSPFGLLTLNDVINVGAELKVPDEVLIQDPDDKLPGSKPDEERLGFTYEQLDKYIRSVDLDSSETKRRINSLYFRNRFKNYPIDTFDPKLPIHTP